MDLEKLHEFKNKIKNQIVQTNIWEQIYLFLSHSVGIISV